MNSSVMHDKTHLLRPTYPGRGLSRARRQPLDAEYRISDAPCRSCPREFVCGENYQLFQRLVVRECGQTRRPHEASCDRTALAAPLQRCIPMSLAYLAHITTYIRRFAVFISSEIMIQRFVKIYIFIYSIRKDITQYCAIFRGFCICMQLRQYSARRTFTGVRLRSINARVGGHREPRVCYRMSRSVIE